MASEIDWTAIAQIAVPAVGAWFAAWMVNKRERAQWEAKQEIEQQKVLGGTVSQLSGAWGEMTTQLRELVTRLQVETIEARTRAAIAEDKAQIERERAEKLERELSGVRREYKEAIDELEALRQKGIDKGTQARLPRSYRKPEE